MNGLAERIETVRGFNRFYTKEIGVLAEHFLDSPYSLTEGRILYALTRRSPMRASEIGADLGLDAGYLSRTLRSFKARGLITTQTSKQDRRAILITPTAKGRQAVEALNDRASVQIGGLLNRLTEQDQKRLVEAMERIRGLLGTENNPPPKAYVLRRHRPGDLGWVVYRHGLLYAEEYGWNEEFEGLVSEIIAGFVKTYDPKAEGCWIAEVGGEPAGSVFLVRASETVAKLRLLLVEPSARGLGIGRRLVEECIRFARQVGYKTMTLWTQSMLTAARRIYQTEGFTLVKQEPHHSFGKDLVGETWELRL